MPLRFLSYFLQTAYGGPPYCVNKAQEIGALFPNGIDPELEANNSSARTRAIVLKNPSLAMTTAMQRRLPGLIPYSAALKINSTRSKWACAVKGCPVAEASLAVLGAHMRSHGVTTMAPLCLSTAVATEET